MSMDLLELAIILGFVVLTTPLLGAYMARVFTGERTVFSPVLAPAERLWCRLLGTGPDRGQD